MSIKKLEGELKRFLRTEEPEVICIKGKWGVGKTYSWNYFISNAVREDAVALGRYSYVSLFGLNSLNELKYAIFEGMVATSDLHKGPQESFIKQKYKLAKNNLARLFGFVYKLPVIQSRVGLSEAALFFSVRSQIVCLDDLERAGNGLRTSDVLGMISMLKEQRNCKVVLLLNEEELSQQDKTVFDKQFEKVFDIIFDFNPTALEVADIAFPDKNGIKRNLHANCITLEILNIRVIKKIEHFAFRLEELLKKDFPELLDEAMHSVTLICWCVYQPEVAPTIEFLKDYNRFGLGKRNKEQEPNDLKWLNLLTSYRFGRFSNLDQEIFAGIKAGYFNVEELMKAAGQESETQKAQDGDTQFNQAWDLYHESFDNNQEEVADAIYLGAMKALRGIHPANLDSAVNLLRNLGRAGQATELIHGYVKANPRMLDSYDENSRAFWGIRDKELLAAFKNKNETKIVEPGLLEVVLSIKENGEYDQKDVAKLTDATVEDYYGLFKTTRGDQKRMLIKAVDAFMKVQEPDDLLKIITSRCLIALKRVASENKLNYLRVSQFINLPEDIHEI